ncbi:BIG/ATPase V1 complex, subunit S1 [Geopyxis carbonaria]|nr:BIG/ATPase V1 complex, subunit S1 [Geopyxis carbonaria]
MPRLTLTLLPLLASAAYAYTDASPYLLASTSPSFSLPPPVGGIHSTSTFLSLAQSHIASCPSDAYILVSQPGLAASDLARGAVHLKSTLTAPGVAHWAAENVVGVQKEGDVEGGMDMESVVQRLLKAAEEHCGAHVDGVVDAKTGSFKRFDDMRPKVLRVEFARLPEAREARGKMVAQNDAFLHSVMEMLPTKKWSLFYVSAPSSSTEGLESSTPPSQQQQQHSEDVVAELRRRTAYDDDAAPSASGNRTHRVGGLFENYQFFTPGIFMGYIAFVFMAMILYVGLSAVSGLEVSYGAFEKENGPGAQKKQ